MSTDNIKLYSNSGKELKDSDLLPSNNERINVLYINEYKNRKFNSEQNNNLKKGYYKMTYEDTLSMSSGTDLFWSFIANNSGLRSEIHEIRSAVGLTKDDVKNKRIGDIIFLPSKTGLEEITVQKKDGVVGTLSSIHIHRLRGIGLYANYLANSTIITELVITSMLRTAHRQAEIVYEDAINYPDISHTDVMYTGETGRQVREAINRGMNKEEVLTVVKNRIRVNPTGFRHVNNDSNVMDLGAGSGRQTTHPKFKESFIKFQSTNKWLSSANSIPWGEKGEANAYHIVFR